MVVPVNENEALFCEWLHAAILDKAPVILTLFNHDSFRRDSYLELRYASERPFANLYFCGNGMDKVRQDDYFRSVMQNHVVPNHADSQELLDRCNPFCYLDSARISEKKLSYLFEILYECHGMHLNQTACGRDWNFVNLKIYWPVTADFCYWLSPKNDNSRIKELVWLLADYLPRPARQALQPTLPQETIQKLQNL